jgi:sulfopyruvate decarboxylase beta subunit
MPLGTAERIADLLRESGVEFFGLLPCEKTRELYSLITTKYKHVTLSKEEEGVGISAGASLTGAKPGMLIQSSGIGNMINALCSLTKVYEFPLPILASWRGVFRERIPAQVPLGQSLPKLLKALDIKCTPIKQKKDIALISKAITNAYETNAINVILLSPAIWEVETSTSQNRYDAPTESHPRHNSIRMSEDNPRPELTRFDILKIIGPYLENKIVVCNLGIPCKELYSVKHQKSNFYMLGSMGLATSIGLGISLFTSRKLVVIEGDGSLLTNLGALSTVAAAKPKNLSILAIDNGVHGSTGNQPTATSLRVDLEMTARGLGFQKTYKVASREEILSTTQALEDGPSFLHIVAKPGNADVVDVPLSPLQIKRNVELALRE